MPNTRCVAWIGPCSTSEPQSCGICPIRRKVNESMQGGALNGSSTQVACIPLNTLASRLGISCPCVQSVTINACKGCRSLVGTTHTCTSVNGNAAKLVRAVPKPSPVRGDCGGAACFACHAPVAPEAVVKKWKGMPKLRKQRHFPRRLLFCGRHPCPDFLAKDELLTCNSCYRSTLRAFRWRATTVTAALRLLGQACTCQDPCPCWFPLFKTDTDFEYVRSLHAHVGICTAQLGSSPTGCEVEPQSRPVFMIDLSGNAFIVQHAERPHKQLPDKFIPVCPGSGAEEQELKCSACGACSPIVESNKLASVDPPSSPAKATAGQRPNPKCGDAHASRQALKRKAEPSAPCSYASVDSNKRTRVRDSPLVALKQETGQPARDRNGGAGASYDDTWPSCRNDTGMPATMFKEVVDTQYWAHRQPWSHREPHMPSRSSLHWPSLTELPTASNSSNTAPSSLDGAPDSFDADTQAWMYPGQTLDQELPPADTSIGTPCVSGLPIHAVLPTDTDPRGDNPALPLDPGVAKVIRQDALGSAQRPAQPRHHGDMGGDWIRYKRRPFSHSDAGESTTTSPHLMATDIAASATVTASSACSSLTSSGPAGVSQNSLADLSGGDSCEPMTPEACFPATVASSPQRVPTLGLPTTEAFSCAQEPGETRGEHH